MKAVLWLSRHAPLPAQTRELRRLFGADVRIDRDPRPFDSAEDILRRVREGGYDEVVVVAPLWVIARLCEAGLRPLWAEMRPVPGPTPGEADRETVAGGRWYRFERFRRIVGVRIEFEEIGHEGSDVREPDAR